MPNPINTASPEAERYLLGVCLRDSLPLPTGLIPSDFIEPTHQEIASTILQLADEGISADELTVTVRLRENKSTVDTFYVSTLTTETGFTTYNNSWGESIKRYSILRTISNIARKTADLALDPASDPERILAYYEGSIKAVQGREEKKIGAIRFNTQELLSFDRQNDPNCVLGNRWLCKGGSALWVSQSGVGKSSLCMQASIRWSIGKDFFGIKPKQPLRIVILQNENDFGDTAEAFSDVYNGLFLHPSEQQLLEENLAIFRDTVSVGATFPNMLRAVINQHRADLIFVDPLLAFAGIDIADQEQASKFCRHDLNSILVETGCVLIAMHHTTKPRTAKDKEGQTVADLAYSGSGSAEFVNYFREVGVLVRQSGEEPVFKFGFTKRRGRSGLKDLNGDFAGEILIRHARQKGCIRWEYADPSEVAQADPSKSTRKGS
jgi:hypothetical protein